MRRENLSLLPRRVPQGQDPCMKREQQGRLRPLLVSRQFLMLLLPVLQVKKQIWGVQLLRARLLVGTRARAS